MKLYANKKKVERSFQQVDQVYLKLKSYRQRSIHSNKIWKLSPKYVGPFQIQKRVGKLAYKLILPPQAKIHPVFHVFILKMKVGPVTTVSSSLPEFDDAGKVLLQAIRILTRRLVKRGNSPTAQQLVQWAHLLEEEVTWEYLENIQQRFPHLLSWGQDNSEGGSNVREAK